MSPETAEGPAVYPFYSSKVSHAWKALGYPSEKAARFWDTRSCGVACLRMIYERLLPDQVMLPATITEELLRDGAYSEQSGWNHAGLVRHARRYGLQASQAHIDNPDQLAALVPDAGGLIVSIAPTFNVPARTGHLAVLTGITQSGHVHLHRPSSQHLTEGRNLHLDMGAFWEHFSGRTIHISGHSPTPA